MDWLALVKGNYLTDLTLSDLLRKYHTGLLSTDKYKMHGEILTYKGRIHLGQLKDIQLQIMQQMHDSPQGGRSGFHKTISKIRREFYWQVSSMQSRNISKLVISVKETRHKIFILQD